MYDIPTILAKYQRDGVVRLKRFLSPEAVEEVRREFDRYIRDDLASLSLDARTTEADGTTIRNLSHWKSTIRTCLHSPNSQEFANWLVRWCRETRSWLPLKHSISPPVSVPVCRTTKTTPTSVNRHPMC